MAEAGAERLAISGFKLYPSSKALLLCPGFTCIRQVLPGKAEAERLGRTRLKLYPSSLMLLSRSLPRVYFTGIRQISWQNRVTGKRIAHHAFQFSAPEVLKIRSSCFFCILYGTLFKL
jgi:hypothetical protein